VAVGRGAAVLPYPWRTAAPRARGCPPSLLARGRAEATAGEAVEPLAGEPRPAYARGARLVLPSPNGKCAGLGGGGISPAGGFGSPTVIAGCLRNAAAVVLHGPRLAAAGGVIVVLGARRALARRNRLAAAGRGGPARSGGRAQRARSVRIGLGAALLAGGGRGTRRLPGGPPAALAEALRECGSAVSWSAAGFGADVDLAAALDVSTSVPVLRDGAFVSAALD